MDIIIFFLVLAVLYGIFDAVVLEPKRRLVTLDELKQELASHNEGNEKYIGM